MVYKNYKTASVAAAAAAAAAEPAPEAATEPLMLGFTEAQVEAQGLGPGG